MNYRYTTHTLSEGILTLTFANPRYLNPFNKQLAEEMRSHLKRAATDPEVKVVVITGKGRAFSAGGDLRFFNECLQAKDYEKLYDMLQTIQKVILAIRFHPKIIIAAVHGHASGGGANLAHACDYVLCDDTAAFTQSFVKIGLAPDAGGMYLLSRAVGSARAFELCTSGRTVYADEAQQLGLVHAVYPVTDLPNSVLAFAKRIVNGPTTVYAHAKELHNKANFSDFEEFIQLEAEVLAKSFQSDDFFEGVNAFLEKRRPVFKKDK